MGVLKRGAALGAAVSMVLGGCGSEHDILTIPLETDTYISNTSEDDHADLEYISIMRSAGGDEHRALVKLPTGKRDSAENAEEVFLGSLLSVFFIPWAILTRWANCKAEALVPENVNSAHLDFTVHSGSVVAGDIQASLMSKAWWHTASWERAHPFSSSDGAWSGGAEVYDTTTFTPITNDMNSSDVRFVITDYFKQLIQDEEADDDDRTPHYGFRLDASASPYAELRLKSVQAPLSNEGPRIVVDYDTTGTCGESSFPDFETAGLSDSPRMLVVTPLKPGAKRYYVPVGGLTSQPPVAEAGDSLRKESSGPR